MRLEAEMLNEVLEKIERLVDMNDRFDDRVEREVETLEIPDLFKRELVKALRELLNPRKAVRRGFFLVVTGIDKSGKETQCFNPAGIPGVKSIREFLEELGGEVLSISLPSYDTFLGSLVGAYLGVEGLGVEVEGEISEEYAWILWGLDRAQYNTAVRRWLSRERRFVLARRWVESNLCYQVARGIGEDRILRFERNVERPDLTLVIDITAEEALRRASKTDRYEKLSFLRKVRATLLDVAFREVVGRSVVVNGMGSPVEVNRRILRVLEYYLTGS
ncbi:hypothetical protein J7L70_07445 [Candidatus Bathyarchaeota archaeon]|nr:hypothetical protein [Candidatus Bathyarchaeota archaeon]